MARKSHQWIHLTEVKECGIGTQSASCKNLAWPRFLDMSHLGSQRRLIYVCSGSAGASVVAHSVALSLIEIAFSTLDCSIVPTCGAWGSATAAKREPLKQSWAVIQHSRDDEPLGVLMQMRNVRVNGFFFFSSLWAPPGVFRCVVVTAASNVCLLCYINSISSFKINTTDWTLDQAWGLMKSSYYFVTNVGSKCVNRHPFVV